MVARGLAVLGERLTHGSDPCAVKGAPIGCGLGEAGVKPLSSRAHPPSCASPRHRASDHANKRDWSRRRACADIGPASRSHDRMYSWIDAPGIRVRFCCPLCPFQRPRRGYCRDFRVSGDDSLRSFLSGKDARRNRVQPAVWGEMQKKQASGDRAALGLQKGRSALNR
jgi:hypothetical protein